MKKKSLILIIAPRIPDSLENSRDKRFYHIIKTLAQKFQVHFLFFQSMFTKEESLKRIEELGVRIISLREKREFITIQKRWKSLLGEQKYSIILFKTCFIAKYCLPYVIVYSPESILAIDAGTSQYISEISFAKRHESLSHLQIGLLNQAEISKNREIPIYNYADLVIVEDEKGQKVLTEELPNVSVGVIPKLSIDEKNDRIITRKTINTFSTIEKKKVVKPDRSKIDIIVVTGDKEQLTKDCLENIKSAACNINFNLKVIGNEMSNRPKESIVKRYNSGLKESSGNYVLILTDNVILPEHTVERMLFCAKSHPANGIVAPVSNLVPGLKVITPRYEETKNFLEFLKRHYIGNFGYWREVKKVYEFCMLIKKELLDKIGFLDERFTTMTYADFDFCLRALQADYRTIVINEVFVYYRDFKKERSGDLGQDRSILIDKWCNKGAEFLKELHD